MKNISLKLSILALAACFISCTSTGEQIESSEAKNIPKNSMENQQVFSKIKEGCNLAWTAWHVGGLDSRNGFINYKSAEFSVMDEKLIAMSAIIDMKSINVIDLPEDAIIELGDHLKSDDFFSVESFPFSLFELTKHETLNGEYNSKITGNLTILGITKSISFKGNLLLTDKEASLKSQAFIINRADWGMTYNAKGTAGVPLDYLISDDIQFQIDISVLKK